jgi:glycosyltransferase involved in cell wall biosynthesis
MSLRTALPKPSKAFFLPRTAVEPNADAVAFSVVIPLYNKAAEIGRTVMSVLAQTLSACEVLVVDDGSTDGSADVVRGLTDPRVRLIQQANAGVAAARNRGIAEAVSEWVAFLDADDEWLPSHLSNLDALHQRNPQAALLATAYSVVRGPNMRRRVSVPLLRSLPTNFLKMHDGLLVPSGTAMTKRALEDVGGYREIFGEDVDIWFRLGALYPTAYSRLATAVWRLDAGNRRTHKIQAAAVVELYVPGGLMPSLDYIKLNATVPSTELATKYLAAHERKMILRSLRAGDRNHALVLYEWWKQAFGKRDRILELHLAAPRVLHRFTASLIENLRRSRAMLGYGVNRLRFAS